LWELGRGSGIYGQSAGNVTDAVEADAACVVELGRG
jgi:hypothetical protein